MATTPPSSPGLFGALRSLADGFLATVQERIELFTVEFQEEKFRLIRIFILISAAVFTGMMSLTFVSLVVVYLFWESARLPALGGLAVFYAAAFAALILALRRMLAGQAGPFAATLLALREDRAWIRNER